MFEWNLSEYLNKKWWKEKEKKGSKKRVKKQRKKEVQFSCSVVSDSLWPHELQHARPPCPSPTLGVHPNPRLSSWWCHPTISSSVVPFSSCPQSCPASGSFQMSQLFALGGQSIGVSASTSVLQMNTQSYCVPCKNKNKKEGKSNIIENKMS